MTQVINIDALKTPTPLIIEVGGVKHEMKVPTVQSFIDNMALLEGLSVDPSVTKELEVGVKVICSQFPTLTEVEVRSWQISVISQVMALARGGSLDTPAEETAGNAPTVS